MLSHLRQSGTLAHLEQLVVLDYGLARVQRLGGTVQVAVRKLLAPGGNALQLRLS